MRSPRSIRPAGPVSRPSRNQASVPEILGRARFGCPASVLHVQVHMLTLSKGQVERITPERSTITNMGSRAPASRGRPLLKFTPGVPAPAAYLTEQAAAEYRRVVRICKQSVRELQQVDVGVLELYAAGMGAALQELPLSLPDAARQAPENVPAARDLTRRWRYSSAPCCGRGDWVAVFWGRESGCR